MSRGKTNKLYRTFTKGLITEAGFLTYPENASTDELNTVIKKKGSRSRRFGIEYETGSTPVTIAGLTENTPISEFHWLAVGSDASVNFLVLQIGSTLHFFDTNATPISSGKKSFTVNLLTYKSPTAADSDVQTSLCQMDSGKGFLFVVQSYIEPLVIEYDAATDALVVLPIIVQMRDFDGLNDGLQNDEEPTTLSKEHYYNLKNQGWVMPGKLGVLEGPGSTNPNTAPPPPEDDGSYGDYNPWTGDPRVNIP